MNDVTKAKVYSYDGFMEGGAFFMEAHVVQRGETLWKISRQYGISFEELRRVNAHLANPDYVVPGMKIFIPEKTKDANLPGEKKPSIEKKPTPPVQKENVPPKPPKQEVQPKPAPKPEKKPVPTPKPPEQSVPEPVPKPVPKPTPKPIPKPESKPKPKPESKPEPKPKPELEKPVPPPVVPPVQRQPAPPMQPYPAFPMIGVPCGWLPIYDADCFQHIHPTQMHPHSPPMQQLPVELEPTPVPPISKQPTPQKPPVGEDWKSIVSPSIEEEVFIPSQNLPKEQIVEPRPVPLPKPSQPTPRKPELQQPIPLPQAVVPPQNNNGNCMYCGGQSSYPGHPLQCSCQMQPRWMPMPMPMPQQHGLCQTCQQPMQNLSPMMPFPAPPQQWYGMY